MNNKAVLCTFAVFSVAILIATSFTCLNGNDTQTDVNFDEISDENSDGGASTQEWEESDSHIGTKDNDGCTYASNSNGPKFWVGDLQYRITDDSNAEVIDYEHGCESAVVPDTVDYEGKTYVVNGIGEYGLSSRSPWATVVHTVEIGPNIQYLGYRALSMEFPILRQYGIQEFKIRDIEHSKLDRIGERALAETNMTDLVLPASLLKIEECAFLGCDVENLTILGGTNPLYIDECAFLLSDLKDATIQRAEYIGDEAFSKCYNLRSVMMNSLTSMGAKVFYKCEQLKMVVMPSLKSIGNQAFKGCDKLMIVYMESVTEIRKTMFEDYENLETIYFPSVTNIGDSAFEGCTNLKNVNISSATYVGSYSFKDCDCLTSIDMPSLTSMGKKVFDDCDNLREVKAPNVKSIGNQAFADCDNLQKVDMESVTEIRPTMFEDYENLETVNFPSATKIGQSAFEGCTKLKNVNIDAATYIDSFCFKDCDSLEKIDLKSVTYVSYKSFESCDNLREVNMPVVEHISGKAFYNTSSLTKVVFSDSLEYVGGDSFPKISFYGTTNEKLAINANDLRGLTFIGSEGKLTIASSTA